MYVSLEFVFKNLWFGPSIISGLFQLLFNQLIAQHSKQLCVVVWSFRWCSYHFLALLFFFYCFGYLSLLIYLLRIIFIIHIVVNYSVLNDLCTKIFLSIFWDWHTFFLLPPLRLVLSSILLLVAFSTPFLMSYFGCLNSVYSV